MSLDNKDTLSSLSHEQDSTEEVPSKQETGSVIPTKSVNINAIKEGNSNRQNMEALANPQKAEALRVLSNIAGMNLSELPPEAKAQILRKRADDISSALVQSGHLLQDVDALRVLFCATAAGADESQFLDMMVSGQHVNFSALPAERKTAAISSLVDGSNSRLAHDLESRGINPRTTEGVRQLGAAIVAGSREPGFLDQISQNYGVKFSNIPAESRTQSIGAIVNNASSNLAKGRWGGEAVNSVRVLAASTAMVGTISK